MDLVYIGEEYVSELPDYVKPFQEASTGKQYGWMDLSEIACHSELRITPASPEQMRAAWENVSLIKASLSFLSQFSNSGA